MGSASWIDFGPIWRQLDVRFEPSWPIVLGSTLAVLAVALVGFIAVWIGTSAIEGWRSRPVPQLDNPILEGATVDLAAAVELLRDGEDPARAEALLAKVRSRIARCRDKLSPRELRVLSAGWKLVASVNPHEGA